MLSDRGANSDSNQFQPLYGCNHPDAKPAQQGKETSASARIAPDPAVAARGMAFEVGYDAGSREAREVIKKSLIPELEAFLSAVEDLTAFQSLVAETAADRIVELAFVMAELITGVPPSIDRKKLDAVKSELESDISDAYQMTLIFHPEDDQSLQQAFAYSQMSWPAPKAILMETDNNQTRHQISAKMQEKCFENHAIGKLMPHLEANATPSTS